MRIFHLVHVECVRKRKMHNLHKAKITVILWFLLLLNIVTIYTNSSIAQHKIYFRMFGVLEITSDCASKRVFD